MEIVFRIMVVVRVSLSVQAAVRIVQFYFGVRI